MSENRFKKSVDHAVENTSSPTSTNDIINNNDFLDELLQSKKKATGKNHTIYLSAEVSDRLEEMIRQTKKGKSFIINKLLEKILLEK